MVSGDNGGVVEASPEKENYYHYGLLGQHKEILARLIDSAWIPEVGPLPPSSAPDHLA